MFPNDITKCILSEVTEKDKAHFALTCKKWMNWVIDHVVFKTLVKHDTFVQSSFIFSSVILDKYKNLPTIINKRANITYAILDINNLLYCHNNFSDTVKVINRYLEHLPNLKHLDFAWGTDQEIIEYTDNLLIIRIPESVEVFNFRKLSHSEGDPVIFHIGDKEYDLEPYTVNIIYTGKKIIIDDTRSDFTSIHSSQCTYLKIVNDSLFSDLMLPNLEVIKCPYDCDISDKGGIYIYDIRFEYYDNSSV